MICYLAIIWLLQDFLQVFTMGILLLPNVYLLVLIFIALLPNTPQEKITTLIWAAFIGGLFWDLRWTNLPGLTVAANCALLSAAYIMWRKSPAQGRSTTLFTVFIVLAMLLSGLIHFLFWTMPSQAAIRQFAVQQISGVSVVVLISLIFWRVTNRHG